MIPESSNSGVNITAVGDGANNVLAKEGQVGTFGFVESGKIYVPKTVKLPSSIRQIGNNAFAGTIDNTAKKIYGVTNINLPDGLEAIGQSAFQNARLTSIILPNSVTKLGISAFGGTDLVEKIVLSKSLKEIPDVAFGRTNDTIGIADKVAVTDIVILEGVTDIGRRAFVGCKAKTVSLPDSLTKIGDNAFMNNQFEEVTIPGSVTNIGKASFEKTAEAIPATLKSLKLKEGFNGKIGSNAFLNQLLTSVELPKSFNTLSGIDKNAFRGISVKPMLLTENKELEDAYNNMSNKDELTYVVKYDKLVGTGWASDDFTYSADGSTITGLSSSGIAKRNGGNHNLVLPDESPAGAAITAIADGAFAIPESEVIVGKYDFTSENGFETVKLPAKLKAIGARAFEYNMLKAVDLEAEPALTKIGTSAFHGNRIQRLSIPDSVKDLGEGAFAANSIIELKMSRSVTKIPQAAFSMNIRLREIEIPDTVTEIGQMAFAGARLESLKIPASVTKIGEKAFHLHHLTELTIPGTVKEIGDSAFEGTYKALTLTDLKIEEGVEHIGKYAFKEGFLTSVDLPKSLKTLGSEPFLNNTGTDTNHVVILRTENPDHLAFNNGAATHKVIMTKAMITFDANGGTIKKGYAVLNADGKVDALPNPTAPDALHDFEGWFTEREGGRKVSAAEKFADGTKLYAHWKLNTSWNEADFTTDGDTVTGLTEAGKAKLAVNPDLKIPAVIGGRAIKKIGIGAFSPSKIGNKTINTIAISKGIEEIGQAAFSGANLKMLEVPSSVKIIGRMAFNGAPLEQVKFSEGLESIGDSAFEGHKLTEVKLPDSLKTIGRSAFKTRSAENASITDVKFGKSLESIGREAFVNQKIKEIQIPESLKHIRREVDRIFLENKARYGYRRIHAELKKIGIKVSEKVVRRVMKEDGLEVKIRKTKKYSSYKGEISPAVPNEVQRNFHSEKPNELLLSDISEFAIPSGKVYLSPTVDCFDGMLVKWRISEHPNADLVNGMLGDVIANMGEKSKPIIHTDRGCHYRWPGWIERMEINGYTGSMSQKGCSPDNAACEGLFGRIKNEFFYNQDWKNMTIEEFSHELDKYLHWYNEKRIKKSLGYLSPVEYRRSLGLAV
ncbi:IS3 family transposase [Mogibacterium timidum]